MHHFLKKVSAYPVGSMVQLSNGEHAVVVQSHTENIMRPEVRVLESPNAPAHELDLLEDAACYHITITGMAEEIQATKN